MKPVAPPDTLLRLHVSCGVWCVVTWPCRYTINGKRHVVDTQSDNLSFVLGSRAGEPASLPLTAFAEVSRIKVRPLTFVPSTFRALHICTSRSLSTSHFGAALLTRFCVGCLDALWGVGCAACD